MTSNEQILQQIDDLVASKTFGLDALEGIKQIKDSLKDTLSSLHRLQDKDLVLTRDLSLERSKNAEHEKEISALKKQISEMHSAAEDGKAARFESDKHQAVADAWRSAMAMVFKPNAVRETIQRNHVVAVPVGNGSSYTQSVTNQDHVVREDA